MPADNRQRQQITAWARAQSFVLLAACALLASIAQAGSPDEDLNSIGEHWANFRLSEPDTADVDSGGGEPTLATPGESIDEPPASRDTRDSRDKSTPEEVPPSADVEAGDYEDDGDLEPIPGDFGPHDDHGGPWEPPASTCSSGTWLYRGGWYSQTDFSFLSRSGPRRRDFVIEVGAVQEPISRQRIDESLGYAPGVRFTLGEILCRDGKNRDRALEFTYFGLHDWHDEKGVTVLITPDRIRSLLSGFDTQAPGFTNVRSQRYFYDSNFNSAEANLRISRRLGRDRMELTRDGRWVRKCAPGPLSALLAGVRMVRVDESFDLFSEGFDPTLENGSYLVDTENTLLGMQMGAECVFQHCKWRAGVRVKGGTYVNFANQESHVRITDPGEVDEITTVPDRDESVDDTDVSFLGEVGLLGSYQLRPNVALRAAYDFMWINRLALGPDQVNFLASNPAEISVGGGLFYHGGTVGVEMVW